MKKIIGLLFGGESHEHEVSKVSARSFLQHIDYVSFDVIPFFIGKNGEWKVYSKLGTPVLDLDDLVGEKASPKQRPPMSVFEEVDIFFSVIHGETGEDGRLQGFFEMLGHPYVGCGVESSVTGMNKVLAKEISSTFGNVNIVPYQVVDKYSWQNEKRMDLEYPVFVKPSRAGSSVGISKVYQAAELSASLDKAFEVDVKVIIEKAIIGREIELAVIGKGDNIEVSQAGWIEYQSDFYDYENKYQKDTSVMHIPAPIDCETEDKLRLWSQRIYRALECEGYARVDFFVEDQTNQIYFNEINTAPGLTEKSMFPSLFKSTYTFPELLTKIINNSIK